jgi:4-amino-4-deoxy-L-arabinose transferase-like glycosyltransferase
MATALSPEPVQAPALSAADLRRLCHSPLPLVVLLLFGMAVRCRQYFAAVSYWYDESFILVNVFERSFADLLGPLDHQVVKPPLFLWALRAVYLALGRSELAMRLPPFLFGMAALLVMVPLARRVVSGSRAWLWPVAFCALSGHAIMHAWDVNTYAGDFCVSEVILLGSCLVLTALPKSAARRAGFALLGLGAVVGPWLSFPAVFVLAGASAALFVDLVRRRDRALLAAWLGLNGLVAAASLTLWYFSARHLYYRGLVEHWSLGFPDLQSPWKTLTWTVDRLFWIGHYGTRDMGWPLLVFVVVGVAGLARRAPALVVLLTVPVAAGFAAAFLRRYPMDDRLVLYAVPCWWLLAGVGIAAFWERVPARATVVAAIGLGALLSTPTLEAAKQLVVVQPRTDYRGAFQYVHDRWSDEDRLWVAHAVVYETYFGRPVHLLSQQLTPAEAVDAARSGRLWIVATWSPFASPNLPPDSFLPALRDAGCTELERAEGKKMDVRLYGPAHGLPSVGFTP